MSRFAAGLAASAAAFVVLAALGARADAITRDEGPFLHYGLRFLEGPVPRKQVWNSKLPVTALHALPVAAGERLLGRPAASLSPAGLWTPEPWALATGRAVAIALGAALVVAVGLAARSLAGPRAGLAAALLAALEPDLLAHGHYVTADGGAALATLAFLLAVRRLDHTRRARDAALAGAAFGAALLAKFQLAVLGPLALAALGARALLSGERPATPWTPGRALGALAAALVATVLTLDAGYLARGLPGRLPETPRSRKVAAAACVVGRAPLPLPQEWLDGLDWVAADEEQGRGFASAYLLGSRSSSGFASYYAVALAVKLPLGLLALLVLGWAAGAAPTGERFFLLAPAAAYVAALSLASRAQIGVRHALPLVPLLLVEGGAILAHLRRAGGWRRRAGHALVLAVAASTASFAPDFLPYVNEAVPRDRAWRVLADSNLDWGQARDAAAAWLEGERARGSPVAFEPDAPVAGRVLVSVGALCGATAPWERFAWLRERTPVGHVRGAYVQFLVPEDAARPGSGR